MAKNPSVKSGQKKQHQESLALQRVFNVFLLGLAAECYLLFVYRGYVAGSVDSLLIWHKILTVGTYVGLVLLLAGAVTAIVKRSDGKLQKAMLLTAGLGLFLAVSGWVMTTWMGQGVNWMCIGVVILTLLGLVYFLFQHECFLSTLVLAAALLVVWVCSAGLAGAWKILITVGVAAAVLLLAALALLLRKLQCSGGKLSDVQLLSPECDYRVLYAICAVSAAAVLTALLVSASAYYLLWALGVLLFAEMVYYTTKLM